MNPKQELLKYLDVRLSSMGIKLGETNIIIIDEMVQGSWNYNYLIMINSKKYVFRMYSKTGGGDFSNQPLNEYKILEYIKCYNIAPIPYIFDDSEKIIPYTVLMYEYVEGENFSYSVEDNVALARIIAKLHNIDYSKIDFLKTNKYMKAELLSTIDLLFEKYRQRKFAERMILWKLKRLIRKYGKIAEKYPDNDKQCLLHNDLITGNIIQNNGHITLIDWQDPVIGDPSYDVWFLICPMINLWNNKYPMTDRQRREFLREYVGLSHNYYIIQNLKRKSPLYYLRAIIYALNRYCDFKEGKIEAALTKGREDQFEKYSELALYGIKRLQDCY